MPGWRMLSTMHQFECVQCTAVHCIVVYPYTLGPGVNYLQFISKILLTLHQYESLLYPHASLYNAATRPDCFFKSLLS